MAVWPRPAKVVALVAAVEPVAVMAPVVGVVLVAAALVGDITPEVAALALLAVVMGRKLREVPDLAVLSHHLPFSFTHKD